MQRFWNGKKLSTPFSLSAEVKSRGYSLLLERIVTDFGADISFGQVVEKLKEHYGITISASASSKHHQETCSSML